jgi:hypothetical protein
MSDLTMLDASVRPSEFPWRLAQGRLPIGLGLLVAATLSGLMWLGGLLAVHSLLA